MINALVASTGKFPEEEQAGAGYWHMHLPVAEDFIDSYKTPRSVRRACMQTLVDRVHYLQSIKPAAGKIRVVAGITLPWLWDSQLIVFFGDDYYGHFFERNSEYQSWTLLEKEKHPAAEYCLNIPAGLTARYYLENISDENYKFTNYLFFVGDLD